MLLRNSRGNYIEIDLLRKQLHFYQGSTIANSYPVAIGKPSTPAPVGQWHIINKKIITYPSVFGTRWMGLNNPGYGIHGTNNPRSIGTAASLGCIRMHNNHVEELFSQVNIGTPVIMHNGTKPQLPEIPQQPILEEEIPREEEAVIDYPQSPPLEDRPAPEKPSPGKTYTIKAGDTLWSISQRYGIPLNQLIKANMHLNPNNLQIGQIINLP